MTRAGVFACVLLLALPACKRRAPHDGRAQVALETEQQKTLYALGTIVGRNVASFTLSPAELELVEAGISDAATGRRPRIALAEYGPRVSELGRTRAVATVGREHDDGKAYADKAARAAGAERTPSGLVFQPLRPGTGRTPARSDTVEVNYRGTLIDGTEFDSSYARKQAAEFPLAGVIPCWTEALQKMKVGGKARLVCPSRLAYGDRGRPPRIPGGATLVFDVELVGIAAAPAAPAATTPPSGASATSRR
jgi:FKBP-type peptidyl-prolyl cis-trans isomerase FkpA